MLSKVNSVVNALTNRKNALVIQDNLQQSKDNSKRIGFAAFNDAWYTEARTIGAPDRLKQEIHRRGHDPVVEIHPYRPDLNQQPAYTPPQGFPPVPARTIGTTQVAGIDGPQLPVPGRRYFLAGQTAMNHNNEVRSIVSDTIARNDPYTYPSVQKERASRFNQEVVKLDNRYADNIAYQWQ